MIDIKFNARIYKLNCIKRAIKDYSHLAKFELEKDKEYILIIIKDIEKGYEKIIKDEFCNYVLYLLKC